MPGHVGADVLVGRNLKDVVQQLIAHMDGRPCITWIVSVVPGIDRTVASKSLDQQPRVRKSKRAEDLLYRLEHLVPPQALIELLVLEALWRIIFNTDSAKLLPVGVNDQTAGRARPATPQRQRGAQNVKPVARPIDDGAGPQITAPQVSDRSGSIGLRLPRGNFEGLPIDEDAFAIGDGRRGDLRPSRLERRQHQDNNRSEQASAR